MSRRSRPPALPPQRPYGDLGDRGPDVDLGDLDADVVETAPEVDAAFRTQRRIAVAYFLVFLVVTLAVPALTLVVEWWSEGRLIGGMSPAFVMTALGLYAFYFALSIAVSTLATSVEDRMLGAQDGDGEDRSPS